jgi:hypothetical protein
VTTAVFAHGSPRLPLSGLLALAAAAFTDVMTDLLPAGSLPQMSGALRIPEARIGLLVSAFAIASALAAIPVTAAVRGLPRRPVLASRQDPWSAGSSCPAPARCPGPHPCSAPRHWPSPPQRAAMPSPPTAPAT